MTLWILLFGLLHSQPALTSAQNTGSAGEVTAVHSLYSVVQTAGRSSRLTEVEQEPALKSNFEQLNGVAPGASSKQLVAAKGWPQQVSRDPFTGYTEYHYGDVTAGLYEGYVYYAHIEGAPEHIELNGQTVFLKDQKLFQMLGKPDYRAEDGDVYEGGENALKIFRGSGRTITGIDLFDVTSS